MKTEKHNKDSGEGANWNKKSDPKGGPKCQHSPSEPALEDAVSIASLTPGIALDIPTMLRVPYPNEALNRKGKKKKKKKGRKRSPVVSPAPVRGKW